MVFARKSKTTKFEDYDDVLNQDEAARLLGVSVPTLCKYLKTGAIKSQRIGRRILILKQNLIDWLAGRSSSEEAGGAVL